MVVAGGSGSRFGRLKQFEPLGAGTVLDRAVAVARPVVDYLVVVVPAAAGSVTVEGADAVTEGGATRSESVRAGLAALVQGWNRTDGPDPSGASEQGVDVVVVHDAARPLASAALLESVVRAVRAGADGAVPGLPVNDTVKRVIGSKVHETVSREGLFVVQTPQAFRLAALLDAHDGAAEATDDAALVEAAGGTVVVVDGEPENVKVTSPFDLRLVEALLSTGALERPGVPS
ncbi:MAG: IspD/TarI family cytidylyltransferase [Actinomycetota bacterium]|nr:IspD/TarI family cytidylyltransferase [Actinomycetota bacterium]